MDTKELIDDIIMYGYLPPRQEGDISANDIVEQDPHGRGRRWAHSYMKKLAAKYPEKFKLLEVYDSNVKRGINVLRVVEKEED